MEIQFQFKISFGIFQFIKDLKENKSKEEKVKVGFTK